MENINLSDAQLKNFKAVFNRFDSDSDGVVSVKEVGRILRSLGHNPSDAELQELITVADKDGSGSLDFPEFLNMMKEKLREENQEDEIKKAFKLFDRDGNGYIDKKEFALMMKFMGESVTDEEIQEIIDDADVDRNGLIDYSEFLTMMSPGRS